MARNEFWGVADFFWFLRRTTRNWKMDKSNCNVASISLGVLGEAQGYPPPDGGNWHIYIGWKIRFVALSENRGLDIAGQVLATTRLGNLRVPSLNYSTNRTFHAFISRRFVFLWILSFILNITLCFVNSIPNLYTTVIFRNSPHTGNSLLRNTLNRLFFLS